MIEKGTCVFWIPDGPDAMQEATAFCRSRGLTRADAMILRRAVGDDARVGVITKRACLLKVSKTPESNSDDSAKGTLI